MAVCFIWKDGDAHEVEIADYHSTTRRRRNGQITLTTSFPASRRNPSDEFLEPMGVTQYRLAMDLKIPHSRVTAITLGRCAITPDTAFRLSRYFGTSAEFWIGLQQEYDLRKARVESEAKKQGPRAKNMVHDQDILPKSKVPQLDPFADFWGGSARLISPTTRDSLRTWKSMSHREFSISPRS